MANQKEVKVKVPSKDLAGKDKDKDKDAKKKKEVQDDISEEDKKLKEDIEFLAEQMRDPDVGIAKLAIQTLMADLRASTSSMTSVPKPLKFLRPFFPQLHQHFPNIKDKQLKNDYADVMALLSTTFRKDGLHVCLYYAFEGNCGEISSWGYEYLRNVTEEMTSAYKYLMGMVEDDEKDGEGDVDVDMDGEKAKEERKKGEKDGKGDKDKTDDSDGKDKDKDKKDDKEKSPEAGKDKKAQSIREKFPELKITRYLPTMEQITFLVDILVSYYMKHNAESDGVDLLSEIDQVEKIEAYVDQSSHLRVVTYLLALSSYIDTNNEEYTPTLGSAFNILLKYNHITDAMRLAIKLNDHNKIQQIFDMCDKPGSNDVAMEKEKTKTDDKDDDADKKQDNIHQGLLTSKVYPMNFAEEEDRSSLKKQLSLFCNQLSMHSLKFDDDDECQALLNGESKSAYFLMLAKELDVLEPKKPEDVYKSVDEDNLLNRLAVDSAKHNLASSLVNAFVNAGFCHDKLVTVDGSQWIYKNKDHAMISAAASIGGILLWSVDEGLNQIDKFQYSQDVNIKAGALLAFGVLCSNVRHECDATFALLKDVVDNSAATPSSKVEKIAAVVGLGCAYAGTRREDLMETLTLLVVDSSEPAEVSALAAVSLGLVFVASGNQDAAEAIISTLLDRSTVDKGLDHPFASFFGLGLGLIFLNLRDAAEPTLQALQTIEHQQGNQSSIIVEGCAYATTGDVLKLQKMLNVCGGNYKKMEKKPEKTEGEEAKKDEKEADDDEDEDDNPYESVAVSNIALIAFSEDIGSEMTLRMIDHLWQYCDVGQRRAIPLSLCLHSPSNPKPAIVDMLSKLSHDPDPDTALNAILALGIVGAGTNNSRVASLLRQLAAFYKRDTNALFIVRIAQGLLYMGKGLLTINPLMSDRFLVNHVSMASLIIFVHLCMNMKHTILGQYHYLLYYLFPAMHPRFLLTMSEFQPPPPPVPAPSTIAATTSSAAADEKDKEKEAECKAQQVSLTDAHSGLYFLPTPVRVGQSVDIVGQVGRQPKIITAFQTHATPVLLNQSERAELASDEYLSLSSVLEGVVILKKNQDYKPKRTA